MSNIYDDLVYKYFVAFSAEGIPSYKGYITGVAHAEDTPLLHVKLTDISNNDSDIFDDFDQHPWLPAVESDNWNIYFDYCAFTDAIDHYAYFRIREKPFTYERQRQETITWKTWETQKLLENK
jgi:hypothetical protein